MGLKHFNHINIGYCNIPGVLEKINNHPEDKLSDPDFSKLVKDLDSFCLSETHVGPDFGMHLKDFKSIKSCRKVSDNNRYFGGLYVFISNHIKQGVVMNDHPDIIWIKLRKDFSIYQKTYSDVLLTLAHLTQSAIKIMILYALTYLNTLN